MVLYVAFEYASDNDGPAKDTLGLAKTLVANPLTRQPVWTDPKTKFEDDEESHTKRAP